MFCYRAIIPARAAAVGTLVALKPVERKSMHKLLPILAAIVATAAFGGMYDQPYALVERGMTSDTRKEVTLAITGVDGKPIRDPRRSDPITPGKHTISVRFQSMRFAFRPE